jgi:CHASE3 domain sensor protein
VAHTLEVQNKVDDWMSTLLEIQNDSRAYVASGNPAFIELQPRRFAAERTKLGELRQLVADNPAQVAAVDAAGRDAEAALQYFQNQLALVTAGEQARALTMLSRGDGKHLTQAFLASAAKVRRGEEANLAERRQQVARRAWATLFGSAAVALLAFGLLSFAWRRELAHEARLSDLARAARQRLRHLSELASALTATRSVLEVAEVIVEQGLRAAAGDTCTVYRLDASGRRLELLSQRGVASDLVDRIRVVSDVEGNPDMFRAAEENRSVWAESEADYAAIYPGLANAKVSGQRAKAFWSVPLVAEGRSLGLLGVGFYTPRKFTADERAFVDSSARKHCCARCAARPKNSLENGSARRCAASVMP